METARVEIRQTPSTGRGVFATEMIPMGTLVARCQGEVLKTEDVLPHFFVMQVGDDLWLCSEGELLDDCFNHSCEPNIGFITGEPSLYAIRDILPDEEICWDYSSSISELGWTLECRCGSGRCRGLVRSFGELLPGDRERLRPISLFYLREPEPSGPSIYGGRVKA